MSGATDIAPHGTPSIVMPPLVAGIHVFQLVVTPDVDGWNTSGHDEGVSAQLGNRSLTA